MYPRVISINGLLCIHIVLAQHSQKKTALTVQTNIRGAGGRMVVGVKGNGVNEDG